MNIRITQTSYSQDPEWLMSDHKVHRPGGVTIDSSKVSAGADGRKVVKAGTPIGMNSGGKWEPYDGDPDAPNVVPTDLLFNTVDVTDGDEAAGSIIHGVVNVERLPEPELIDTRVRVNMPGIHFVSFTAEGQPGDLDLVGPQGPPGEQGPPGRGIADITYAADTNELVFEMTDSTEVRIPWPTPEENGD